MSEERDLEHLRAEYARLVALLERHGIDWRGEPKPSPDRAKMTTARKVGPFGRLFKGRTDVFPVRWEGKAGKACYSPACANEWRPGVCEKPRVKCSDCGHRKFIPVTERIAFDHLAGRHTIGVHPSIGQPSARRAGRVLR
jgi:hypothetical protein